MDVQRPERAAYADRNMRYNYYDFTAGAWNFIDPTNFMNSGVNVFTIRSGFGMLDVDPVTGVAYVCCHQTPSNINPTVAQRRRTRRRHFHRMRRHAER